MAEDVTEGAPHTFTQATPDKPKALARQQGAQHNFTVVRLRQECAPFRSPSEPSRLSSLVRGLVRETTLSLSPTRSFFVVKIHPSFSPLVCIHEFLQHLQEKLKCVEVGGDDDVVSAR